MAVGVLASDNERAALADCSIERIPMHICLCQQEHNSNVHGEALVACVCGAQL